MVYIEYELYLMRYHNIQRVYDHILAEKERLFQETQSKAISYEPDRISGTAPSNKFDNYLILMEEEEIEKRLSEAKSIIADRERLLEMKEAELRVSNHLFDKIYRMRYLDHMSPKTIGDRIGYSKSQVYRILDKIEKNRF